MLFAMRGRAVLRLNFMTESPTGRQKASNVEISKDRDGRIAALLLHGRQRYQAAESRNIKILQTQVNGIFGNLTACC